jgi:hypothetical protein
VEAVALEAVALEDGEGVADNKQTPYCRKHRNMYIFYMQKIVKKTLGIYAVNIHIYIYDYC